MEKEERYASNKRDKEEDTHTERGERTQQTRRRQSTSEHNGPKASKRLALGFKKQGHKCCVCEKTTNKTNEPKDTKKIAQWIYEKTMIKIFV